MNRQKLKFLHSPWAISLGALLGIAIGALNHDLAHTISPVGDIYLALLQLCVFPILVSAVSVCIFRLLSSDHLSAYLSKMSAVYFVGFIAVAAIGISITAIASPGSTNDPATKAALGKLILESSDSNAMLKNSAHEEIYLSHEKPVETSQNEMDIVTSLIPQNIFESLVEGNSIQVLTFSIILGLALGFLEVKKAESAVNFFDSIFDAFAKVVAGLMYLLPFGLCALLAKNISIMGSDFLFAVLELIIVVIGVCVTITIVGFIAIYLKNRHLSLLQTIHTLREPLFIAFATTNSLATIPSAIMSLSKELKLEEEKVTLIIPIGITVARFGSILLISIMALYMAQLYEIELSFSQYLFILVGSIMAGVATAGAPGEVAASLVAVVLTPLGLPAETAITILLLTNPLIDPFVTTINVQGNIVATNFIVDREKEDNGE